MLGYDAARAPRPCGEVAYAELSRSPNRREAMVRFGADIPGPGAIEAIALAGRDRQFAILNRRSSLRPTDGRTICRVIQVGLGTSVLPPGVCNSANVATLPIRARSGHQQPRPKARRFEVKEMVNRAGPSSAIFPQHSIGSSGSPQMGVGGQHGRIQGRISMRGNRCLRVVASPT